MRSKGRKTAGIPATGGSNRFRIIGGRWRGRRLSFPALPGIRPSPDRVRETLFNWLAPVISGARCLDLFAGSGALGLEALSRGAGECWFVDRESGVVRQLQNHLQTLETAAGHVVQADAMAYLQSPPLAFDIVFLDPPYASGLLEPVAGALAAGGWLAPGAFVYLENAAKDGPPPLPAGWTLHRSQQAGQVGYHLALANRIRANRIRE